MAASKPGRGPSPSLKRGGSRFVDAAALLMKENDQKFLAGVTSASPAKDVKRLMTILARGDDKAPDPRTAEAACQAAQRMCRDDAGFLALIMAGGVPAVLGLGGFLASEGSKKSNAGSREAFAAARAAADGAVDAVRARALAKLGGADHVDAQEIPNLVQIMHWVGAADEEVAVEALDLGERFARHRVENCVALLQYGALTVLHGLLGAHQAPELVQGVLALMFRITDLPQQGAAKHVAAEGGLVRTVAETLENAPLNMRLQLAGLRVLALWSKLQERDVQDAIMEANAQGMLRRVHHDLEASGYTHCAAWAGAIASRALGPVGPGLSLRAEDSVSVRAEEPMSVRAEEPLSTEP